MKLLKSILLPIMFAGMALAQTTAPTTPVTASTLPTGNVTTLPSYIFSVGASYNKYATPSPVSSGFISAGIQIGGPTSRFYSLTTIDQTQNTASIRTGAAYVLLQSGNFTLATHVDGGITTVNGNVSTAALGSFSGGGILLYDLGGLSSKFKGKGLYAEGVVRLLAVNGSSIDPCYEFGVAKTF